MASGALQADTAHTMVPMDLLDCQYVTLHVPLTPETKDPINRELLVKMMKGATLINSARPEVMHEAEMLEVLSARPDFCHFSKVPRKNAEESKALVGDKFMKRVIFTKRKMGAQTLETLMPASFEQLTKKEVEWCHSRSAQRLSSARVQTLD